MRCIFCKANSSESRSVEHIVPESLGNRTFTLPPGIVCDKCNNYFATKIEQPFLAASALTHLRFYQALPSKRGRIPSMAGTILPDIPAVLHRELDPLSTVMDVEQGDLDRLLRRLDDRQPGQLLLPAAGAMPASAVVSRFLAKVALEAMAERLIHKPGGIDWLVDEVQLDEIRDHARRGGPSRCLAVPSAGYLRHEPAT